MIHPSLAAKAAKSERPQEIDPQWSDKKIEQAPAKTGAFFNSASQNTL
jgi:hypothetical protein